MLKGPTESTEAVTTPVHHPFASPFTKLPFKPLQCSTPSSEHDDAAHLPTNITVSVIHSSEGDVIDPDCLGGFIQNSLESVGASAIDPIVALSRGKRRGRKPKIVVAEEDKEAVARIAQLLEHEHRLTLEDICMLTGMRREEAGRLLTTTAYFFNLVNCYWIISPELTQSQMKTLRGLSKASTCTLRTLKQRVNVEVNRLEAVYAESSASCFENWNGVLVVEQELLEWRGSRKGWTEETFEVVSIAVPLCDHPSFDVAIWHDLTGTFI